MNLVHTNAKTNTWAAISLGFILILNISWIWSHFEANFTFYAGEATRDFITAKHIIEYGDTPLIGPYSAASQNLIKNSPAYFYFLAFFLLFFKSFTALCIFSIALFLLTLTFIFLLAYKMFGLPQAIISALIMSINLFFSCGPNSSGSRTLCSLF